MSRRTSGYTSFDFQRYLLIMLIGTALLVSLAACSEAPSREYGEITSESSVQLSIMNASLEEHADIKDSEKEPSVNKAPLQNPAEIKPIFPRRRPPVDIESLAFRDEGERYAELKVYFGERLNREVTKMPKDEFEKSQNLFAEIRHLASAQKSKSPTQLIHQAYLRAGYSVEEDFTLENENSLQTISSNLELIEALLRAGWIPFETKYFKPSLGAVLVEIPSKDQGSASSNSRSLKTKFSSSFFLLPPGIHPQTWDQSLEI